MSQANFSLQNSLISLGFSDKEALVYLSLLELGKGTVSQIARKASVNRTTCYHILNSLINRSLVNISGKEPKQEYGAESPDKIVSMFNNFIEKNKTFIAQSKNIIPQLKSVHNVKGRPKVRFYEGKEGIKQVYEDTLSSHETIRAFASVEDTQHTMPDYFPSYYFRRADKKIGIRAIFPSTPEAKELTKTNKQQRRETALVPADKFAFSPEINIYNNKVMIASWREELGITIESEEIAEAMKKIFELAWAEAKRLEKELKV